LESYIYQDELYSIYTIKATDVIKHTSTPGTKLGQLIYIQILTTASDQSLTPKSNFPAQVITGMAEKSTDSWIAALSKFATEH
jgi:hypothetical protein